MESVLNTDRFDRRRFREIYGQSEKMQEIHESGRQILPSFLPLMGDMWASLYKMSPELKENVHPKLEINRMVMEQVMNDHLFQNFREYTRLDDFASALGAIKFSEKTREWMERQKKMDERLNELLNQALEAQREAEQKQQKAEQLKQQTEEAEQNGDKNTSQLKKKAEKAQAEADQAQENANQAIFQAAHTLQGSLNNGFFQQMIAAAANETREAKENVKSLLGGFQAGNGDAELRKVPLRDQLALADVLSSHQKLKKIAEWAGRFKAIARQKQKAKHVETVERNGISIGNSIERLLPMELGYYSNPVTKQDFLRRFAEGQTLQYSPEGKETLGKGPIILCLDQSGSMNRLDEQSKGFALALMMIARKQKRDFALILFSTVTKTLIYEKGKIKTDDLVELATTFLGGGTHFDKPLLEAVKIIEKSRFKKADIIFVTDGEANLYSKFIENFQHKKKEKQFQVLSIVLGDEKTDTVKLFSDEVVKASSFTDNSVTNRAFRI
ncbi:VWA domain-containing protein [Microaerobacter geothermalis]|uniref:VWA domain-containing protein n=1 Tax=Microaerobacter geothermalis TaxID=674972 RepID=UPI001F361CB3|nr:VWA domain-containing protein [Microaerobacter geothermalis]MCF6095077.1 VWA domain-containing protein [Microaerobacter geothermalis]